MIHLLAELDEDDIPRFRDELVDHLTKAGIRCRPLSVTTGFMGDEQVIEVTAELLEDAMLSVRREWQKTVLFARAYCLGEVSEKRVIWGEAKFSVDREHSFFYPVPDEYGERVSIRFGWEFDIDTLTPTYADVRDRNSVHYCSILPSKQFQDFVGCFSRVLNAWNIMPDCE
jgi:hypothetical protein